MTPEQTERLVAAMERIATALTTLAHKPPMERFREALPNVTKVAQAATLWRKAWPTLTEAERDAAWPALVARLGDVAKIKNAEAVLKQELAKPAKKGGAP